MKQTRKITVTLPVAQVHAVRGLVVRGEATSLSAFVRHAVGTALDDVAEWHATLDEALEATGGTLTPQEREWADRVLGGRAPPRAPTCR